MTRFTRTLLRRVSVLTSIAAILLSVACQDTGTGGLLPDEQFPVKGQSIEVAPSVAALVSAGERVQLSAHVRDALGKLVTNPRVSWASTDPAVAAVDGSGMVTGMGEGVAEVKGTYGTLSATATVAVSRPKLSNGGTSVTIYPEADTVSLVGGSAKLLAVGRNNGGNLLGGNRLQWSSAQVDIAAVDGEGVVTGVRSGKTQIIVKNGPAADTAEIWVAPSDVAVMVRITPDNGSIGAVGESVQLTAEVLNGALDPIEGRDITWNTLDPSVASVSGGKVVGLARGTARIIASHQTLKDTATITVASTLAATSLYLTPKADTVRQIGGTTQLKATVLDANGQQLSTAGIAWGSLDAAVATVSSSGLVKAAAAGQARITARLNSLVDTAMIWVVPATTTSYVVTVDPSFVKLGAKGDTVRLRVTIKDANGNAVTQSGASWTSLDVLTASVSTTGPAASVLVSALNTGTARIVASYSGAADTAVITIGTSGGTGSTSGYVVSITPQPAEIPALNQTVSLLWEVYDSSGNRVPEVYPAWSSLDPTIATVPTGPSRRATVTGIGTGTARIVTVWNGLTDTATVVVKDGPASGTLPAITVSPSSATLNSIGATTQLNASAWDAQGAGVASTQLTWTSLDPAIVSVNGSGLVTAAGNGSGRVKVSYSTVADTAWIWVSTVAAGNQLTPAPLRPLLGPLVNRSTAIAPLATYDKRYEQVEYLRFQEYLSLENDPQGAYLNGNHYGGLRSRLMWAIRNGEPWGAGVTDESRYGYARGKRIIRRYLAWSSSPSVNYNVPAHNNTGLADIEALYVLEGDATAKMHIACTAASVANDDPYGYFKLANNNTDARIPAVALQSLNAAIRLGLPYSRCAANGNFAVEAGMSWKSIGDRIISWFDQYGGIRTDGSVVATSNKSETYFMDAMLASELLRWHGFVAPHPRAYELATRIMDFVIREYQTKYQPLGWNTLPYLANSNGPAADLAAYYIWPSLVLWQETGDQKYYDFAMLNLKATGSAYIDQMKQFNQVYSTLGQDFESLVAGLPWH